MNTARFAAVVTCVPRFATTAPTFETRGRSLVRRVGGAFCCSVRRALAGAFCACPTPSPSHLHGNAAHRRGLGGTLRVGRRSPARRRTRLEQRPVPRRAA